MWAGRDYRELTICARDKHITMRGAHHCPRNVSYKQRNEKKDTKLRVRHGLTNKAFRNVFPRNAATCRLFTSPSLNISLYI